MKDYDKIAISELKPYENNARTHSEEQLALLVNSINEFGFVAPVIIDENNVILVGHGRTEAAKRAGLTEVPYRRITHLTDDQKKAYILADNKLSDLSGWDLDLLDVELSNIDLDMSQFGFDVDLSGLETDDEIIEDEAPQLKTETDVKLGDIYLLGNHRLICGDSTDEEVIKKLMDGAKADMVFTDPPYGMNLDTDFSSMIGIGQGNEYEKVIGDNDDFTPDLINTIFNNFGYCKEMFLWGADYYAELIPERNNGSWIVWDKMQNGEGVNDAYDKMFGSNFELCWSKAKHKRALARILWKGIFGLSNEDTKRRVHPTQKPVLLVTWFLEKFKGDLVVDLFGGSGSTLIACEQLNRTCYMCELDPYYVDVIKTRWENFTGKKAVKI